MPRYFVIWCLEDDVEQAIDAFDGHGEVVDLPKIQRHVSTNTYSGSAEVLVQDQAREGATR